MTDIRIGSTQAPGPDDNVSKSYQSHQLHMPAALSAPAIGQLKPEHGMPAQLFTQMQAVALWNAFKGVQR
jgi:hypothetical protein